MFKYDSWKRASSGHIHLKGKVNHFINMRQDCCGISPIFLCLEARQGEIVSRRSSKLMIPMGLQLTVTAQKYFASTAGLVWTSWIIQSSQPPSGTCRPSCWRSSTLLKRQHWHREAASTWNSQPVKIQDPQKRAIGKVEIFRIDLIDCLPRHQYMWWKKTGTACFHFLEQFISYKRVHKNTRWLLAWCRWSPWSNHTSKYITSCRG